MEKTQDYGEHTISESNFGGQDIETIVPPIVDRDEIDNKPGCFFS